MDKLWAAHRAGGVEPGLRHRWGSIKTPESLLTAACLPVPYHGHQHETAKLVRSSLAISEPGWLVEEPPPDGVVGLAVFGEQCRATQVASSGHGTGRQIWVAIKLFILQLGNLFFCTPLQRYRRIFGREQTDDMITMVGSNRLVYLVQMLQIIHVRTQRFCIRLVQQSSW